jgi:hypothetical protein
MRPNLIFFYLCKDFYVICFAVKYSESKVGVGFVVDFTQDQIFRAVCIKAGKVF